MKKITLFIFLFCTSLVASSQTTSPLVYKLFKHSIENCRESEDIILYQDGSFCVYSCIANIAVSYRGGWWMTDTSLVLQTSQNCAGPKILEKTECHNNTDELSIEIYNEKGLLKYCGFYDEYGRSRIFKSDGYNILNMKENIMFRYFDIAVKGRRIQHIKTRKYNNNIVCIVLEPVDSNDVYLGKISIPLRELKENDNKILNDYP